MNGETSFWAKLGDLLVETDWPAVVKAISVAAGHQPPYVLVQTPRIQPGQPPRIHIPSGLQLEPPSSLQLEPPSPTERDTAETMRIIQDILNREKCSKRNEIRWLRIPQVLVY